MLFRKNEKRANRLMFEQVDTIVGSDIVYIGDLRSTGSIRYEGTLRGNMTVAGNAIIGRNAFIVGDIQAENILVIGHIEGNIKCRQLRILSTGKLTGNVECENIIQDDGAIFIGECTTIDLDAAKKDISIDDILDSI